jgi:hypothetical protein
MVILLVTPAWLACHFTLKMEVPSPSKTYVMTCWVYITFQTTIAFKPCLSYQYSLKSVNSVWILMCLQTTQMTEGFVTNFTGKWWLLIMFTWQMILQLTSFAIKFFANITWVRSFTTMNTLVLPKITWPLERFITHFTQIWPFSSMHSSVIRKSTTLRKSSFTNITEIWTFPCMYTSMNL